MYPTAATCGRAIPRVGDATGDGDGITVLLVLARLPELSLAVSERGQGPSGIGLLDNCYGPAGASPLRPFCQGPA